MTVVISDVKRDLYRKHRRFMCTVTYGSGDTELTVDTGLKKLYSYSVSPTSVTGKAVDSVVKTGGVLTINVADPLAACYLTVSADGI